MSLDDQYFPATRRALTREVIVDAVDTRPAEPRRVRTATVLAIVAGAVAIPTAGATAYYAFAPVEDTRYVRCFTSASLSGDAIFLSRANAPNDPPAIVENPVAGCGDLWSQGVLLPGVTDAQPPTPGANLPVPELSACVIADGDRDVVAVVPGGVDVCAQLGLLRWQR